MNMQNPHGLAGVEDEQHGDFMPFIVSSAEPAALNCFTCASTLWPSVETRA
jgi:hypothetical protein